MSPRVKLCTELGGELALHLVRGQGFSPKARYGYISRSAGGHARTLRRAV
ncbi:MULTISPECIES: hypothetical protein [Acidithiobacillus]|uniref:Uncharacterized protein n=1 Tax=Acidithiobacillus ferriphilus TaxID=1689834 RepID=A0ABU6FRF1_9PROT|nr:MULTISPECIES: hypothetical protein [Acidithiobacillus]MEB8489681.1 hypothetical protein [Acidithiobacillus ferriphilus]MEB8514636.1 hypothetical protein [Acidithiobacillus ferriphilus]MEB8521294.1 hypothetical protein [Acidithiobacillus ferriphilus]MEB8531790.1 hypothetical protein [Acidithiobacillus ferriphilus]MEB8536929.1 hypothetical protein [Acidithiobacillus ferriphilus]